MKNTQINLLIIISILSTVGILAGCGGSSQKSLTVDKNEMMSRSALLSSLQYHLLQQIEELSTIYNEHNTTYEITCNNGGTITYNFSTELFPATLTYNQCSNNVSDGNVTEVYKNGVLRFTAVDANRTVTFEDDFNHTVTLQSAQQIETIVQSESILLKRYSTSNQGFFTANFILVCDGLSLKTENVEGAYTDNGGVSPIEGNVIFSTNNALKVGFYGDPGSIDFDNQGNIVYGNILYESGNTLPWQISILTPNLLSLEDETMDVSPYLWY